MYPETFVRKHLPQSGNGSIIFDPFAGRGTSVFEALLNGHPAAGTDVNPVAVCISNAKANAPSPASVTRRIKDLKRRYSKEPCEDQFPSEFFEWCYHPTTFHQLTYLRRTLSWRSDLRDTFIAALMLGILHGESHKSANYLSNRMPRTISTKPRYSVRWWRARNLRPPLRDCFDVLERSARYRFCSELPEKKGRVALQDARKAWTCFPELSGRVTHVITSPPYLNVTDFVEDQWLRLWFLGGPPQPKSSNGDDRHHSRKRYWRFLAECWAGIESLLAEEATIVVRIGGKNLADEQLSENLRYSLLNGLRRAVGTDEKGRMSRIINGQVRSFQPSAAGIRMEYDYVFKIGPRFADSASR